MLSQIAEQISQQHRRYFKIFPIKLIFSSTITYYTEIINPRPRVGEAEGYCNRFVCRQNSSEPANIGTLKILPADVKSYKDQK